MAAALLAATALFFTLALLALTFLFLAIFVLAALLFVRMATHLK